MNLQRAIEIAVAAHKGQTDKVGNLYVLHPFRVMEALDTEDEKIVGVLHDVVEDCVGWTWERMRDEGFSERVIIAH
jgi:(p)ppGpp synthase/HD superfamily hydrolase